MQSVYRIIKRKRNLRRLSVAWLFLLVVELFCPVLCDEPAFAAEIKSSPAQVLVSVKDDNQSTETSVSSGTLQSQDEGQSVCNDECLCHAAAIPSFNSINLKETFSRRETIAASYGKPLFNSLPPPYQPPKNS